MCCQRTHQVLHQHTWYNISALGGRQREGMMINHEGQQDQSILQKQNSYMSFSSLSPISRAHLTSLHLILVIAGIIELEGFKSLHSSFWDVWPYRAKGIRKVKKTSRKSISQSRYLSLSVGILSCTPITFVLNSSVWRASFISHGISKSPPAAQPPGSKV